ncbi:hypothetical protein ELQ92_12435 [Labedella populi]|uniref:Uncharacterized protein n=1 Tax=Labedella populi TaxID=2498850 RepID=A0A3S3ZLE7_9MICO|nr:hypothetical protein [Labedella populi]RWZ59627.1 hypothetical protein ELQ92_12435 [Labedella populi]
MKNGGGLLLVWGFVVLITALQLVGHPAIQPLWLQYLLLVGVAGTLGAVVPLFLFRSRKNEG